MTAMTRGAFAIKIARYMHLPLGETGAFPDTKGTNVDQAVTALVKAGIIHGRPDGTFDPNATVTRGEAATMFGRAAGLSPSKKGGPFSDVGGAMGAMIQATGQAGIFHGVGGGIFNPSAEFQDQHFDIAFNNGVSQGLFQPYSQEDVTPAVDSSSGSSDPPAENGTDYMNSAIASMTTSLNVTFGIEITPEVQNWLNDAYINDYTEEEMTQRLISNTDGTADWFHERFPAYDNTGNMVHIPRPAEYVATEEEFRRILRSGGFPPGFYDSPDDFTKWISDGTSPDEIRDRVDQGFVKVAQADMGLRQAFSDMFGAEGDTQLAMFFIDPGRTQAELEKDVTAAGIMASSNSLDLGLASSKVMQLAGIGYSRLGAQAKLEHIARIGSLFQESITDTNDLQANEEGVNADFGLDPTSANKIEQRRAARVNQLRGRGGGAVVTNKGIVGI